MSATKLVLHILFFLFFAYAAYMDLKTKELPIELAGGLYLLEAIHLITSVPLPQALWVLGQVLFLGAGLLFAAYLFALGGGDVIVLPLLGFHFSLLDVALMVSAACLLTASCLVIKSLICRQTVDVWQELPLIPGVFLLLLIQPFLNII